jgi:arginase family enzyme
MAIAAALAQRERVHHVDLPPWRPLVREAAGGPAGGDVLGLSDITRAAGAALDWLGAVAPARLLAIGGDCGSDIAPMFWQLARHGDRLGVLYLDAHADLNTPATSPSGRFHGMVLRTALGEGPASLLAHARHVLAPSHLVMADIRETLDPGERVFVDAAELRPWSTAAIADGSLLAAVVTHPATHWHVHFDLDLLDPADFPDVTVPTPGGPRLEVVSRFLVELVQRRDVVGITITEHVGGEPSAHRVAELIAALRRAGWR